MIVALYRSQRFAHPTTANIFVFRPEAQMTIIARRNFGKLAVAAVMKIAFLFRQVA